MLSFEPSPDLDGLTLSTSVYLRWYRDMRRRQGKESEADKDLVPELREVAPLSLLGRRGLRDDDFGSILREEADGLWHLQIHLRGRPRYYGRAKHDVAGWHILWVGETWLAKAVHRGIVWLDEHDTESLSSSVRVVSSRPYGFTSLWIEASDLHLVVSALPELRRRFPLFELMEAETLRMHLVEEFGDRYEVEGIGGGPLETNSDLS